MGGAEPKFAPKKKEKTNKELIYDFTNSIKNKDNDDIVDGDNDGDNGDFSVDDRDSDDLTRIIAETDNGISRYARAGFESAIQIIVYVASRDYVLEIAPYFRTLNAV